MNTVAQQPLVRVRVPTYRRTVLLERCLRALQAQTWTHWLCDVYDDDREGSGEAVCTRLADSRIRYRINQPQKYAAGNIDQCFRVDLAEEGDYFFVNEDDNTVLPEFTADNIRICREFGVDVVLRNQRIEHAVGKADSHVSEFGILDWMFEEGIYSPELFRLSMMVGIGVSNGGLFWSRAARSRLEIGFKGNAILHEFMRTYSISDPVYVAMEPLALWAENAEETSRLSGSTGSAWKREFEFKRTLQRLRQLVWQETDPSLRREFLTGQRIRGPEGEKARNLAKCLHPLAAKGGIGLQERLLQTGRGAVIALVGTVPDDFQEFVDSRRKDASGSLAAGTSASASPRPGESSAIGSDGRRG